MMVVHSDISVLASSLRSTSKQSLCPMPHSLRLLPCAIRGRFAGTSRKEFFESLLRGPPMPNIASRALVDARRGCTFDSRGYRCEKPGWDRKILQSHEYLPGIAHRCESRNSSRLVNRGRTTPRRRAHEG